jgi:hypothetical protein
LATIFSDRAMNSEHGDSRCRNRQSNAGRAKHFDVESSQASRGYLREQKTPDVSCRPEMPIFSFTIGSGVFSGAVTSNHPDIQSAQRQALAMLADLARDIVGELETNPDWCVEVADEAGKPRFIVKISAVSLE